MGRLHGDKSGGILNMKRDHSRPQGKWWEGIVRSIAENAVDFYIAGFVLVFGGFVIANLAPSKPSDQAQEPSAAGSIPTTPHHLPPITGVQTRALGQGNEKLGAANRGPIEPKGQTRDAFATGLSSTTPDNASATADLQTPEPRQGDKELGAANPPPTKPPDQKREPVATGSTPTTPDNPSLTEVIQSQVLGLHEPKLGTVGKVTKERLACLQDKCRKRAVSGQFCAIVSAVTVKGKELTIDPHGRITESQVRSFLYRKAGKDVVEMVESCQKDFSSGGRVAPRRR
jgi:hypothetical protein